ncbi:flagellar hook-basal body protein [Conexibacter sp. DBS9H8]|uniref:flagellar hook-basal body protein n=1 Tax=Conexibacter sp. DBS9H8 TaxID=2937801 RepID=UPI00200DE999|nr:flagellar hook-basal body complex protein [Conexibacter sp. DBS9H8]
MYSAISGLEAHQTMLNVTANNLANVDTIGYKAQRTTFESELATLINGGSGQTANNGGTNPVQYGLGVQVGSIDNIMGAGSLQSTGNALDVAIQGDGFLTVGNSTATPAVPKTGSGTTFTQTVASGSPATAVGTGTFPTAYGYTRAGNLTTDSQGFLTTASGQYVMGFTAPPTSTTATPNTYIYIPPGSTNVSIGPSGQVTYTDNIVGDPNNGLTVTAGYIGLATFPNEAGLNREAGTQWSASPNSGAAQYGVADNGGFANTQVISGELEQSNVDMATEFTNMIEAERGYQANSSVITTANTMMQTLIQMAP